MPRCWMYLGLLVTMAGCATARPKGYLSSYSEMSPQHQFDQAYIAPGVHFGEYRSLSLEVVNKTGDGGSRGASRAHLLASRFQKGLEDAIRRTGVFQEVRAGENGQAPAHLRVFVTALDPGSQAMRFLVGLGAGAARVEMEGEVVDTATGASVFRFLDARSGDDLFGIGEGENLMEDDLRVIAQNIASAIAEHR